MKNFKAKEFLKQKYLWRDYSNQIKCSCCGNYKYEFVVFQERIKVDNEKILRHFEICLDCLQYKENKNNVFPI